MGRFRFVHVASLSLFCAVTLACGVLSRPSAQDASAGKPEAACEPIPVIDDGERDGELCAEEAAGEGLTVIDLSGDWAPRIFADRTDPYREIYLALANERFDDLPRGVDRERFVEVFGITPTFAVLRGRLTERDRYECHARIDDGPLLAFDGLLRPWGEPRLDDVESASLTVAQAHLRCDGLLDERARDGRFDWHTTEALRAWQRRHLVLTTNGFFDDPTRISMTRDLREADFLAVLRALRGRVADATGLIEDGSASGQRARVLGRQIDPPAFLFDAGWEPLENGAPDRVAEATDAAARALGWTSPEAFVAGAHDRLGRVAVELVDTPRYHSRHMELRAELDRGDVVYDLDDPPPVERRPVLTLYARDGDDEIALVRWPTTIGGWADEVDENGRKGLRYKESPVGARVWRELWAAPSWMPPPTTPDEDLLRPANGRWLPRNELLGPGHRSAYGLAMLVHNEPIATDDPDAEPRFVDEGIRTHGSVSYRSILSGSSHGCHRLHNHLAVRLAGFLLAHRNHVAQGPQRAGYQRTLRHAGVARTIRVDTRGTLYELDPPVPIEVREGRIVGRLRRAPTRLVVGR